MQTRYTLVDLGTLGGLNCYVQAINAQGQVVGYSDMPSGKLQHAFRTAPGGDLRDGSAILETPGITESYPMAINVAGQVAGMTWISPVGGWKNAEGEEIAPGYDPWLGAIHAFRTSADGKIDDAGADLGTLGGICSGAHDINAIGQVTGYSRLQTGGHHAFRTTATGTLEDGSATDLGTLGGGNSTGNGINIHGQVTGASDLPGKPARPREPRRHAFRSSGNETPTPILIDLGTLGGTESEGFAINDSGQVTGTSQIAGDIASHAFRTTTTGTLDDGTATDLGTLEGDSCGLDINAYGHVVGYSWLTNKDNLTTTHAFLYTDEHGMQDLNHLLSPEDQARWILSTAHGINDNGQIICLGMNDECGFCACLLTPVSDTA